MTDFTIRWPDESAERVEAAKGRLDIARGRLIERGVDDVLGVLSQVFELWRDPASTWRRRLLDEHPASSGFSRANVAAGLELALEDWSGDALRGAIESERRGLLSGAGRSIVPFASTSVILGGAIPMPSLLQPVIPLALLSPVLIKPSSRDTLTPRLLAESIAAVDPEIGRAIEVVTFASDDDASLDSFLAAECVVASGSDATIGSLSARIRQTQRFVAYGHRISIAVVEAGLALRDDGGLARALSLDIALWDQLGCLSPVAVYVVGAGAAKATTLLAAALARELEGRSTELPRGAVPTEVAVAIGIERDSAALRTASGGSVQIHAGTGTSWTVIAESEATARPCPLHRFVRVHPVPAIDSLEPALKPLVRHLSSIALSADARSGDELRARVSRLGASRICPPGRLQAPSIDWPHDGRPILAPLARIQIGADSGE
jgi:hypothetical protein